MARNSSNKSILLFTEKDSKTDWLYQFEGINSEFDHHNWLKQAICLQSNRVIE